MNSRALIWIVALLSLPRMAAGQPAANPQLAQARQAIQKKDFGGAEATLREFVVTNPKDARGWYLLGYSLHAQSKLDEALKIHLKAAEFPAVKTLALYNAACVYSRQMRTDEAIATLQKCVAAGFNNWSGMLNDSDFVHIREDKRFIALIPKLLEGDKLFREPTTVLHMFTGEAAGDQFGWVARRVGDIDEDGADDFVTTAPTALRGSGKIYVYSSRAGKLLFSRAGIAGESLGNGAAGAGDVDADGTPDIVVGGPGKNNAYVLSGRGGKVIWELKGQKSSSFFGYKVSGVGDINGDGHDEVAVTATQAATGQKPATGPGRCYVYSGRSGKLMLSLAGERNADQFGSSVSATMEGEHRLLAVGAQDAGAGRRGRVYVYRLEPKRAELLFQIDGDSKSRDLGKMFVSFPGDFNRDGVPDLYASDFADSTGAPGGGRIRILSGLDGELLLSAHGKQAGEGLGTSVSVAGDVNDDGFPDLAVGAWQNREGAVSGGKVVLLSGRDARELATWTCLQAGDTFGFDSVGIGDINEDGQTDFLITSAWSPTLGKQTGRVFIIAGTPK